MSAPVRTVTVAERRARLARRHGLGPGTGGNIDDVAQALVGLHATDRASLYLSAWARIPGFVPDDLDEALYGRKSLILALGMRRTMFVVPRSSLPVMQIACTDGVAGTQRRRIVRELETNDVSSDGHRWLAEVHDTVRAHLTANGPTTGAKLSKAIPALQAKFVYAPDKAWGGEIGVASWVLTLLGAEGHIERHRPTGSWTSGQHRWVAATPVEHTLSVDDATAALLSAWLRSFGPAPISDLVWWSGLGVGRIRATLARLDTVTVDLDGQPGIVLSDDVEAVADVDPWVALLPWLDPTIMGWKERAWYLGDHGPALFDRNGNAGATIWTDGRVVGGWSQRKSGEVVVELLEDIGSEAASMVDEHAARLQEWLGDVVVTPRFPAPLDKRLRS